MPTIVSMNKAREIVAKDLGVKKETLSNNDVKKSTLVKEVNKEHPEIFASPWKVVLN